MGHFFSLCFSPLDFHEIVIENKEPDRISGKQEKKKKEKALFIKTSYSW